MGRIVLWSRESRKNLYFFYRGIRAYLKTDELSGLSPGISYYFIMGFIPFLVFVVNVLLFFAVTQIDFINELIYGYFPERIAATLDANVQRILSQRSNVMLWIGLLASTYGFGQGLAILVRAADGKAYRRVNGERAGFMDFTVFYKSLLLAVGLIIAIILSLGLMVFGNMLVEYLDRLFALPRIFLMSWQFLRYILPFIVLVLFLTLFYWATPEPDNTPRIKPCFAAALLVTVLWLSATGIYSWFMMLIPGMGESYGPLLGLFVLFMWFRYIAYIIIIGIGFIKTWGRRSELSAAEREGDNLVRLADSEVFWLDCRGGNWQDF